MELRSFLSLGQILVSTLLIALVLLQVRGTGFGAALGGQDASFRTRRGLQRSLHRLTIVVVFIFIGMSAWSVAAS
jgi:preprotein translocase subunit SecG